MAKIIDMKENKKNTGSTTMTLSNEVAEEVVDLAAEHEMQATALYTYAQCVRDCLPQIAELLQLNICDLTMDKASLEKVEENLQYGDFHPLVYRASNGDEDYLAMFLVAESDDGYVCGRALEKFKGRNHWSYNFGEGFWEEEEDILSPELESILNSNSTEKDILNEILYEYEGELESEEYQSVKAENGPLFELYSETNKYMLPLFIIDEENGDKLYLEPKDVNRNGFIVGCSGSEYVLYQYLDPVDVAVNGDMYEKLYEDLVTLSLKDYSKEVGRTSDLKEMKKCLRMLANRYIEDVVYTVPLSLKTYTESDDLKNIGKQAYSIDGDEKHELTIEEKKAAESVRKYVKKLC